MSRTYQYPLDRTNHRDLKAYSGPVDIWDIDKTYLLTEFARLRDLIRRAFEDAEAKEARPGAATLLKALRRGPTPGEPRETPLYFVSASPPQMREVLEKKMEIDGLGVDGITFKSFLGLLRHGRVRDLKRHTAYKLTALLLYRLEFGPGAREWLYGDDAEMDARIYSIYAEIRTGKLLGKKLDRTLRACRVGEDDRHTIVHLAERAHELVPPPEGGSVTEIYIFNATDSPHLDLEDFPRVTRVTHVGGLARHLAKAGRIAAVDVEAIDAAIERRANADATPSSS
ncbi:MAG: phosphatase domain-containing protein, partial [Planctomycetota bacterium]